VGGLVEGSPLPVSVKIRLSPAGNKDVNALEHIEALAALDHKPAFVTLHARTATQRYGRAATWEDVEACARKAGDAFPVLGNGDVLTHFEARRKRAVAPTAAGLMVGRGALISAQIKFCEHTTHWWICAQALINPWLFDDIRNEKSWLPTAAERLEVYYSLVAGYRDTFGDDERGRKTAWYFVPFHFNFFQRWRPLSEEHFSAFDLPLIQNGRAVDAALEEIEGPRAALAPLEQLLRCAHADAGEAIAGALWSSYSVADAVAAVTALATPEHLAAWEQPVAEARDEDEGHSSSSAGKKRGGGRRNS
jgi:tRNA-dihydrouridine synthase 3